MEGLAKDTVALEDIYNRMVKMAENGAQQRQAEETKFSIREDENGKYAVLLQAKFFIELFSRI